MSQKTILILLFKDLKHPFAGGSIINAFKQADYWIKEGYKIIFLTPKFKGAKNTEIINNCEVYRYGGKYTSYLLFPLAYLFRFRNKVDYIIDTENGIPYFTPLYSRKKKILNVMHIHKDVFFIELPKYIAWIPYLLEVYLMPLIYRNTPVVTISKATKQELCKIGFKEKNISISYCGIDHEKVTQHKKFKEPTLLYMARVEKYKRITKLIDLFEKLNYPNSQLIIAGGGRDLSTVKERAAKSPLKDRIQVLGKVSEEEKFKLFSKSWLYVTTSMAEGWGLTVIEANASGTPALAFNVPGLNESIQNGVNGFVVNTDEEFIEKMQQFLSKEIILKGMVKHSKQFTWENTAKSTLQSLLNN
ncbi:MAG: glycosyltransferase family 4 protein [Nanoarchaeota archaeon]|nr:glycosyltransferase family 4 protein [Nanoarchaeota archaeon]